MNIYEAHAQAFEDFYERLLEFRSIAEAFGELAEDRTDSAGQKWVYVVRSQAEHLAEAFERLELVYRREVAPVLCALPMAQRPASGAGTVAEVSP